MSVAVDQTLSQAFNLIEEGRPEDAEGILQPLLMTERNNADFWWVYAHAVTDAETAREALRSVLRINPMYPGAVDLMRELEEVYPRVPLSPISSKSEPSSDYADLFASSSNDEPSFLRDAPPPPLTAPELDADNFDDAPDLDIDDEVEPEAEEESRRSTPLVVGLTLIGVIIILGFLALTFLNAPGTEVISTASPGLEIVATNSLIPTEVVLSTVTVPTEVAESAALLDAEARLRSTLSNQQFPENTGIALEPTSLGQTWVVEVCGTAGPERRATLVEVMEAAAREASNLPTDVEAIGARIVNCERNDVLITVASSLQDAASFASGRLDSEAFQAVWRPQ